MDLLTELARENLAQVIFSITSLDEGLRLKLEPRSSASFKKFVAIRKLKAQGIPVSVMLSPVIPGLNDHEIPAIIRESASSGADDIHMTLIRLNGAVGHLFKNWLQTHFPQKEEKILNQIRSLHGGRLNESRFGFRMRGEGPLAASIHHLFKMVKSHYFSKNDTMQLETKHFRRYGMKNLF
jgi:DNA repair photolyase